MRMRAHMFVPKMSREELIRRSRRADKDMKSLRKRVVRALFWRRFFAR